MKTIIKTLVKTLHGENGKLFSIIDGRRILLAECQPAIKIYENSQPVSVMGDRQMQYKTIYASIVICGNRELTRQVDFDFWNTVTRFEIAWEIQCEDGTFERIAFDNIVPKEITPTDDWTFEIVGQNDVIKKLIKF